MPATSATDAALINEAEFLRELVALEKADERAVVRPLSGERFDSPTVVEAFDVLEQGLIDNRLEEPEPLPPHHHEHTVPANEARELFVGAPLPVEPRISPAVAALVLVGCLLAGAAAAVYVRSGPVIPISVLRTATR
jgi:hypothetical protein